MALTAERLRNDHRFSGENVTQFLLFLPFGICLFVFRIILALILWVASIILPNKSSVRQMLSTLACWTFGVYVQVSGTRAARCRVLVANYVSCLDSLAAAHALGAISLRKWKVPPFFASTLGIRNAAQFVRKEHFDSANSAPLLLQPEGGPGSGRGLLAFRDWPFQPGHVQPVAISVERMFTTVTVHSTHSGGLPCWDLFWFLLAPCTVFRVALLPPPGPGAAADTLAKAVADHLQIEATDIPYSSLCVGRRALTSPPAVTSPPPVTSARESELCRRARQVKEVLPRVPLKDIMKDLAATRSVDVTVTNFLDGSSPYTPEPLQAELLPLPLPLPGPSSAPSAPAQPEASTSRYVKPPQQAPFPRNAAERQLGFQERKARMIAEARRRYIEKHGLDAPLVG